MSMPSPDRPALILGATSDIALAFARLLAAEGRELILAARDPARLDAACKDLTLRHGVKATALAFDARDPASAGALLDSLPLLPSLVVSFVGWMPPQDETARDPELARAVIESNLLGPAWALEEAARRLAALEGPTAIVGVGSVAGDRGRARNYWYGAAKAGFEAVLSGLRQKYARSRLHVMTVKPGFVATRMTEGMDLPAALTLTPEAQARLMLAALRRGRHVAVHWKWRLIMGVIRLLPEGVFRRMRF